MKKKIPQLFLSSCLSYWLFITFLPENQLSLAKNFNLLSVCVKKKKKITTPVSPPDRDFSELSPRKWPPPAFLLMPAFLGSVWTTNGGELVNCHCSNNAASLCEKAQWHQGITGLEGWEHVTPQYGDADTRPNNTDKLNAAIITTWASITPKSCYRPIASMPHHFATVIHAKGALTKY